MNDERLNALIETVNDTARTARTTMSLFLVAALYLLWILISSTDETLFLNGQLVLGQLNIGLSLKNSYIIGPLILFFLHIYFLILLQGLRRKVSRFESVLQQEHPRETEGIIWQELRDRISSSIFVQSIQESSNRLSRSLAFLSVVAVPLGLLFAVDLSFIRYQSNAITLIHDALFVTDLIFVAWFGINRKRWSNLYEIMKNALIRMRICINEYFHHTKEQPPETYGHTEIPIPWTTLLFIGVSCLMVSIALFAAHPPVFDHETVKEDQNRIWRERHEIGDVSRLRKIWDGILDVVFEDRNFLDAVPCKSWGIACRYLDISTRELVRMSDKELKARTQVSQKFGDEDEEGGIDRFHKDIVDLNSRKFLFANLTGAWVQGGNFIEVDLRGADLQGAHLEGTNFVRAELQGAKLRGTLLRNADLAAANASGANLERAVLLSAALSSTQLQGANLSGANLKDASIISTRLQGANLSHADLRGAIFKKAWLQSADLSGADLRNAEITSTQLQGADLATAKLQNSDLEKTQMQGVRLSGALLQGVRLSEVNLQGANLEGAQLQGANLKSTELQGADLTNARLQGADFADTQLQGSFGKPDSWCLLWKPSVSFEFPPRPRDPQGKESQYERALFFIEGLFEELLKDQNKSIKLSWREGVSLEEHLKEYLWKGIARGVFDGSKPEGKCMVDRESADIEWCPPPDIGSSDYRCTWASWTAEFACENLYTAASSLDRWLSDEPLYEAKLRFDHLACLKGAVRAAVIERKERKDGGKCPGLSAVSNEKYSEFVSARNEPPPTCGSCAERPDCAPPSRATEAPAQRPSSSP